MGWLPPELNVSALSDYTPGRNVTLLHYNSEQMSYASLQVLERQR